jgi:hypothetical protein
LALVRGAASQQLRFGYVYNLKYGGRMVLDWWGRLRIEFAARMLEREDE